MQQNVGNVKHNLLSPTRRWSNIFSLALILLLLIFFTIHQRDNTGFFTDKFRTAEMVALYLPILISLVAPFLRIMLGTIEPARFVELISDVCLAVGSIWLRHTFPFDFSHIGDIFAPNLRFAFTWLNDNLGRIILLLQIILGFISALATLGTYLTELGIVHQRISQQDAKDVTDNKSNPPT